LGSFSEMKRRRPTFSRPIELSMPLGVSAMRTGALPTRGSRVTVLVITPPSRATSMTCAYSSP